MYFKQILIGLAVVVGLGAVSCSDSNETQQEWLDRGETIYAGKIDSLHARGGMQRIELVGCTRYARQAEKCLVKWNDQSKEFALSEITKNDTIRILLDNMQEGTYRFFVYTYDREGHRSVVTECFGYSYGENFAAIQNVKRIVSMSADFSGATLGWNATDNACKVVLDYRTKDLRPARLELPGDVKTTQIEDWEWGGEIKVTTFVSPEQNALDAVELASITQHFPEMPEAMVPKTKFAAVKLPTDINGNGWGGQIPGIWDGIEGNGAGNRYHSESGTGVPHHFTFDMGIVADLTSINMCGRDVAADKDNAWNPRHFQLWGRATLDGAQTTLPSNDPNWEKEAEEKGWILILDGYNSNRIRNTHKVDRAKAQAIRYIRYRVVESFGNGTGGPTTGPNAYGHVQELTFYASGLKNVQ